MSGIDMSSLEPNVVTTVGAIVCTGVVTYMVNRFGKAADARGAAEAALMGIGPAIIQEQNKRIAQLTEEVKALWERDRECHRELDAANDRILILERKVGP